MLTSYSKLDVKSLLDTLWDSTVKIAALDLLFSGAEVFKRFIFHKL
jgi:hypothetical protein